MSQQSALESLTSKSTLGVRLLFSIWDRAGIDTPHAFAKAVKVNFLYSCHTLRGLSSDARMASLAAASILLGRLRDLLRWILAQPHPFRLTKDE